MPPNKTWLREHAAMSIFGRHVSKLAGFATAAPTPFDENGSVDSATLERFCDRQISDGANALVVCGITGEGPTLSRIEHEAVIRIAVDAARGRIPVIADAGSNSTAQAIELSKDAESAGADAILSVVPYYNKPTQAGIYGHFRAIADSTGLPIILHDVPSHTVSGLADATVARLAENSRFIGLEDATGDMTRPLRLRALLGPDFRLLSGDDATALAFVTQGGHGCISVTSNVAPALCRGMYLALKQGQPSDAQRLVAPFMKLTLALFSETDPMSVKYALSLLNVMSSRVRLPLVKPKNDTKANIASVLADVCARHSGYMIDNFSAAELPAEGRNAPHGAKMRHGRSASVTSCPNSNGNTDISLWSREGVWRVLAYLLRRNFRHFAHGKQPARFQSGARKQ
jgi:4-hydroxy-tetrahydrodipicolinate synthase